MRNRRRLSTLAAGIIVLAATSSPASAQWYGDRDRDWRRPGFSLRFGDFDDDRRWQRRRDRDSYYVVRRYRDRYGDLVERRSRFCD